MATLAEYLEDIARLFGSESEVHFAGLEAGSTVPVVDVEWEAVPKVKERLRVAATPDAPVEVARAYRAIDTHLERDNASAEILEQGDRETDFRKVIAFPGSRKPRVVEYGPFRQDGEIEGVLVRIGGLDDMVPVHLKEEGAAIHVCQANHNVARDLAPYLFGQHLRAFGNGTWFRDGDGNWEMRRFTIESFRPLRGDDLKTEIDKLRQKGKRINEIDDPLAELEEIRQG